MILVTKYNVIYIRYYSQSTMLYISDITHNIQCDIILKVQCYICNINHKVQCYIYIYI